MATEKSTRKKTTRGPTRAKLLEQVKEHDAAMETKDAELEEAKGQATMLAQVPPILFTISINRLTGRIAAIPTLEGSSIEDLRLLLKGVNIHQTQIIDLLADAAIVATEEEESEDAEEGKEESIPGDDNEDVVNEEENDNEDVVKEESEDVSADE